MLRSSLVYDLRLAPDGKQGGGRGSTRWSLWHSASMGNPQEFTPWNVLKKQWQRSGEHPQSSNPWRAYWQSGKRLLPQSLLPNNTGLQIPSINGSPKSWGRWFIVMTHCGDCLLFKAARCRCCHKSGHWSAHCHWNYCSPVLETSSEEIIPDSLVSDNIVGAGREVRRTDGHAPWVRK